MPKDTSLNITAIVTEVADVPNVWGLSPCERLERLLKKLGIKTFKEGDDKLPETGKILLLRGDVIYDTPIVKGLIEETDALITQEGSDKYPVAAVVNVEDIEPALDWLKGEVDSPKELKTRPINEVGGNYQHQLRKKEAPYCMKVEESKLKEQEKRVFMGTYKGVTDLVTKYAWPIPAMWATRWCIKYKLTPNMVTFASFILVLLSLWLFSIGQFGLGLLSAWVMTFLDTVDGKLARCTFTYSWIGNIFDHGIDLIHPPFWYLAWAYGLAHSLTPISDTTFDVVVWSIFITYIAGRILEGYFMRRYGFHLHVWRRFDSFFRLILARRNPNIIILSICWMLGRPDVGIILVAAWTVATFLIHIVQLVQAEKERVAGNPVTSWLSK